MKLDSLMAKLEEIRRAAENCEYQEFSEGYADKLIVQTLVEYIGNKKVEEKINEIPS